MTKPQPPVRLRAKARPAPLSSNEASHRTESGEGSKENRTILKSHYARFLGLAIVAVVTGLVVACSSDPQLLEYTTLFKDSRADGGIQRDLLVREGASREEVVVLLEHIRDVTYPEGWLEIRVFDSQEVWDANRSCLMAWKGWPIDRGGVAPECEESKRISGGQPFLGSLGRHPESDYTEITWWEPQD